MNQIIVIVKRRLFDLMSNIIDINYEEDDFKNIISEEEVREWASNILDELKIKDSVLSLYFTTDEIIKELNNKYRKKDFVTDVLSFPQIKDDFPFDDDFLGDVVISIPQAQKQAKDRNENSISEIKFLILHGILHLNGYDHESDNGEMEDIEKDIYYKLTGEKIE